MIKYRGIGALIVLLTFLIPGLAAVISFQKVPYLPEAQLSALDIAFDPLGSGVLTSSINYCTVFIPILIMIIIILVSEDFQTG